MFQPSLSDTALTLTLSIWVPKGTTKPSARLSPRVFSIIIHKTFKRLSLQIFVKMRFWYGKVCLGLQFLVSSVLRAYICMYICMDVCMHVFEYECMHMSFCTSNANTLVGMTIYTIYIYMPVLCI